MSRPKKRPLKYEPAGEKSGWEDRARSIVENGEEVTDSDIPNIFVWLQDGNWPGTKVISEFLLTLDHRCVHAVKTILKGTDEVWIYFVLDRIIACWSDELQCKVLDELLQLTIQKSDEGVDQMAIEICLKNKLVEEKIKTDLRAVRGHNS